MIPMFLLLVVLAPVYFLPTIVGFRNRNAVAIFALNLFLGWSLIGWVVALVWALTKPAEGMKADEPAQIDTGGGSPLPFLLSAALAIVILIIAGSMWQAMQKPAALTVIDAPQMATIPIALASPAVEHPSAQTTTVAPATDPDGAWAVWTDKSKIDDSENVFLRLNSAGKIEGVFGGADYAEISIVCQERRTNIYFTFARHFMSDIDNWGNVTARIDKQPARMIAMRASTDHEALGLWRGAGVEFVKSMSGHEKLFVRAWPFNENAVEAEFPIAKIEQAIKPLRAACKW